ncbi:MAG: GntR family transcriptional regulator [Hyphomonadaceae bacterium]|nr:GntR family transcriptional regulator [Hyphomonadaceae bacterium]
MAAKQKRAPRPIAPRRPIPRKGAEPAPADAIPNLIADRIRDLIARGALSPGVHLGQMQLAEQFKASRVPVREALKQLAAEGLLQHDANRGFFVAMLSSDEARQLYRMRRLIETEILKSVEWPTKEQTLQLTEMVNELDGLLARGERAQWDARHREFHRAIYDLSPMKVLVSEAMRLWRLTDRYRSLFATPQRAGGEKATKDERHLLRALTRCDRTALVGAFETDRARMEGMLLNLLGARGL